MKYVNGTRFTRTQESSRFQYYAEDCDCSACLYNRRKSKSLKADCELKTCCCADIFAEAVKAGRTKRPKGWAKQCTE
ncbi:MAG: hypothetical protein LBC56_02375 [Oscillospiraceae bacterium]|jgi:hypothetical protein|nr:hypothetical protein [Oscillospiraceae bacterium]